jgi:hypothetical protein
MFRFLGPRGLSDASLSNEATTSRDDVPLGRSNGRAFQTLGLSMGLSLALSESGDSQPRHWAQPTLTWLQTCPASPKRAPSNLLKFWRLIRLHSVAKRSWLRAAYLDSRSRPHSAQECDDVSLLGFDVIHRFRWLAPRSAALVANHLQTKKKGRSRRRHG